MRNGGVSVGVDGCKGGWLAVSLSAGQADVQMYPTFRELFDAYDAGLILVDVPIGLVDSGDSGRSCDGEARALLRRPRRSSVFTPPCRPALRESIYQSASAVNREWTGKGLTKQAFAIARKIREVDEFLRSDSRGRGLVREVHPEVLFWALNGRRPMTVRKSRVAGRVERLAVLGRYLPDSAAIVEKAMVDRNGHGYDRDDVIDALAAAVTASLGFRRLKTLPARPPRDAYGLPMEMVYWEPG